jgi:radical SAM protein with 4Fe4S-binding SPASM domain
MDLQVGNVRQQPFAEIWQHNEVLKQLRSEKYQGYCGICAYRRLCGGCRARSFAVNKGNYMAGDPSCLYRKEQEQRLAPLAEILLLRLQEGFPMVAEPYKDLAGELDASEHEVMEALRWLQAKGVIRRLGATFDSRKLGYTGTLCAAKVPPERVPEVAAVVNASPGVTHNYLRENEYNLWFTLSARSESELNQTIEQLKLSTGLQEIISMPAEHIFKLAVNFSKEDLEGVFTGGAGCYQGFAG